MNDVSLVFKPLQVEDLDLLCVWFEKPHVNEWWSDHLSRDGIIEKYSNRIGDKVVCPYIVYVDDKPIGFIQYYWANKAGCGWWKDADAYTVGLDQFIGDDNYINKGYGTMMLKSFVAWLRKNVDVKRIIIDVDPNNHRAKRCYQKAGFRDVGITHTPDGEAMLMEMRLSDG